MKTIEGYDVKIFTENIEESALEQIKELLSIDAVSYTHLTLPTTPYV